MSTQRATIEGLQRPGRTLRSAVAAWFGLAPTALDAVPDETVRIMAARLTDEWPRLDSAGELERELRGHAAATVQRLHAAARTDGLTGLANRRALEERLDDDLARLRRHSMPLSILLADVDGLKRVNDADGHLAGDTLLCEVAARLDGAVRRTDLVGRWGGDEFIVICPHAGADASATLAAKLVSVVATRPLQLSRRTIPISISVGWATAEPGSTVSSLLATADSGLYQAKSQKLSAQS